MQALVSVIMPAYNAATYIREAIQSIIDQDYPYFELLVINDGSKDDTETIVRSFGDSRIQYFHQKNQGVAAARNLGLANMAGEYFCFLDADDLMTKNSISCRLDAFGGEKVAFVGGGQAQRTADLSKQIALQIPSYNGWPKNGLVRLDGSCFINCGTWLIRREKNKRYTFPTGWSHSEDLAFFLSISDAGQLHSIPEVVQVYRRHESAMSNLDGLAEGYRKLFYFMKGQAYFAGIQDENYFVRRIKRIMVLSYLRRFQVLKALKFGIAKID